MKLKFTRFSLVWMLTAGVGFGAEAQLAPGKDSPLVWAAGVGRMVRINEPQLTLSNPTDDAKLPLKVELRNRSVRNDEALLEYALTLKERGFSISGNATIRISLPSHPGEDVLIGQIAVTFREPVNANLETVYAFDVIGKPARRMGLPERNGYFRVWPMSSDVGGAGKFELGNAAQGPVSCSTLGMPAVGLMFDDTEATGTQASSQLAVAADPYCGSYLQAQAMTENNKPLTHITVRTTYLGSVVPLRAAQRTLALEFHSQGTDRTLRNFYRTIPEIEPGAPWTQGIHLVG